MARLTHEELRRQLLALVAEEDAIHTELSQSGEVYGSYHPRLAEVDARNARALESIIDRVGWRGRVGLGPLGERIDQLNAEAQPWLPADLEEYRREQRRWAESVGWRSPPD